MAMTETYFRVVPSPYREDAAIIRKAYRDDLPPFSEIGIRWEQIPGLVRQLLSAYAEHTGVDIRDFNQHTDIHLRPGSN